MRTAGSAKVVTEGACAHIVLVVRITVSELTVCRVGSLAGCRHVKRGYACARTNDTCVV